MGGWEGMVGWVVGWDGAGARPTQEMCDTFENEMGGWGRRRGGGGEEEGWWWMSCMPRIGLD